MKKNTILFFYIAVIYLFCGLNIACNHSREEFTITFGQENTGGRLVASVGGKDIKSPAKLKKGVEVVFTAVLKPGFKVANWTGVNPSSTDNTTAVLTVANDSVISVTFMSDSEEYTVNFSVKNNKGGRIIAELKDKSRITTGTKLRKGTVVDFIARPDNGFAVKKWTGEVQRNSPEAIRSTLTVLQPETVVVEFTESSIFENDVDGASFKMINIPAADNVKLGGDGVDEDFRDNMPHTISLSPYAVSDTEVTQQLYEAVMKVNPSKHKDEVAGDEIQKKRPVENVSWFDCIVFCNELTFKLTDSKESCVYFSDKEMKSVYTKDDAKKNKAVYADFTKNGYRLLTEAEWEYAAVTASKTRFAGTNKANDLSDFAWFNDNAVTDESTKKTHQVGLKVPNDFGLFDMTGNVWEWCWDWYEEITQNSLPKDYKGPESPKGENGRIRRGGGFGSEYISCQCAYRSHAPMSYKMFETGLRIGCNMK